MHGEAFRFLLSFQGHAITAVPTDREALTMNGIAVRGFLVHIGKWCIDSVEMAWGSVLVACRQKQCHTAYIFL